ncbi:HNH endonuclease [Halorubrum sp. CGM4_25_10-8A]|uniref:HNH endonuclease n=1 Tax=Halorubrum sp. CGM4_25_10-8A TaxID=2518116 RepID=UPI0010F5CFB5|nr:HNH endonuclease [Halorubrum sp. CGM4_25_10-8A]
MRNYPPDWNTRRREVYERDSYRCQNCKAGGNSPRDIELHAHHIVPVSKGGSHNISNLKTLCKDCHNAIHTNAMAPTDKSRQSGLYRGGTRSEPEFDQKLVDFKWVVFLLILWIGLIFSLSWVIGDPLLAVSLSLLLCAIVGQYIIHTYGYYPD